MTFHLELIRTGISEEYFSWRSTGEGGAYRGRLQRHTPFPDCGVDFTAGPMTNHFRILHVTDLAVYWGRLPVIQTEHLPLVYEVIFQTNIQLCQCPFPGCPGTFLSSSGLRNHFIRINWGVGGALSLSKKNIHDRFHILNSASNRCPHGYFKIVVIALKHVGWERNAADGGRH